MPAAGIRMQSQEWICGTLRRSKPEHDTKRKAGIELRFAEKTGTDPMNCARKRHRGKQCVVDAPAECSRQA